MELLYWNPVNRKRSKDTPCTSPDYVKGYDIDVHDMTALVPTMPWGPGPPGSPGSQPLSEHINSQGNKASKRQSWGVSPTLPLIVT